MGFINASHNLPAIARMVYRYLVRSDNHEEEKDRLVALLVPPSLTGPAGKNADGPGALSTTHTLSALQSIGLIEENDGVLRLSKWLPGALQSPNDPDAVFSSALRWCLFNADVSGNPWTTDGDEWNPGGAHDLVRATTWLLSQNALGPPLAFGRNTPREWDAEALQTTQFRASGAPKVIGNETLWENFRRWAPVVGLGRRILWKNNVHLAADATGAIWDVLSRNLRPQLQDYASLPDVLGQVYELLPVLGHGAHRRALDHYLATDPDPFRAAGGEPSCVSQALFILVEDKRVELVGQSDAPMSNLVDPAGNQRFSHIRLRGI